jgi:hypothetical protein
MISRKRKANKKAKKTKRAAKKPRAIVKQGLSKRRGKQIYDFFFKPGSKTEKQIDDAIDKINFKSIRHDDPFVKITFVAGYRKNKASISFLESYEYDTRAELLAELKQNCKDYNYTIWRKPVKGTTKSIKRMNRLKNFLQRIIIDFENKQD